MAENFSQKSPSRFVCAECRRALFEGEPIRWENRRPCHAECSAQAGRPIVETFKARGGADCAFCSREIARGESGAWGPNKTPCHMICLLGAMQLSEMIEMFGMPEIRQGIMGKHGFIEDPVDPIMKPPPPPDRG